MACRVREAQEAEIRINLAREDYRPVAARGSVLYFCITDLAMLSPMYVRSMARFKSIFKHCIEKARPARDLAARLQSIIEFLTSHLHSRIDRGLLEHHKLLFAFLVATNIAAVRRDSSEVHSACYCHSANLPQQW